MEKKITNIEFYKDKLLEFGNDLAIVNGEPCSCEGTNGCRGCIGCETGDIINWLLEPYRDPSYKLTIKERQFCELVEEGYLARDEDGELYCYTEKPNKCSCYWDYDEGESLEVTDFIKGLNFSFIKWEDEEPWSIEDLLKLKVVE